MKMIALVFMIHLVELCALFMIADTMCLFKQTTPLVFNYALFYVFEMPWLTLQQHRRRFKDILYPWHYRVP